MRFLTIFFREIK